MGTLLQDLRYGARSLWNNPGFTLVALLALALGIGATTAIYTVVDAMLLRPLPYHDAQQLVSVQSLLRNVSGATSYLDYQDYVARNHTMSGISIYTPTYLVLSGDAQPQQIQGVSASPNLLRLLGATPQLGRDFNEGDAKPGSDVVIISDALWHRRYNGDPSIIGKMIEIDGEPHVIIGVAPAKLDFPLDIKKSNTELYVPFPRTATEVEQSKSRGTHFMQCVGRLKPGVSVQQAQGDMTAVVASMIRDNPGGDNGDEYLSAVVVSLHEDLVGNARPALIMLLLAVACVLLIACANVAGLLLARATVRQREIAIRTALGAGRARIVRQMLTESALLGLLGGGAGILLALWLVDLLVATVAPALPKVHDLVVDGRILAVTFVLSIVTGLAFGLVPALHASRTDLNDALKETARSSAHTRTRRARNVLLMAEIAVALVLLVGAGMTLRSFAKLQHVNPGFQIDGMVVAQLRLPDQRYSKDEEADRYYRALTRAIKDLPGTESVAIGAPLPFAHSTWATSVQITGQPISPALPDSQLTGISPGYFATFGTPLLAGRPFNDADDQRTSTPRIIISKYFADHLFAGKNPVGQYITVGIAETGQSDTSFEIVGVVGDVFTASLQKPPKAHMYVPLGRWPIGFVGVVARTQQPKAVIPLLRQAMLTVDKNLPPPMLTTMAALTADSLQNERMLMVLLALFAVVALILASIGIYGVMSYTVTQRTREIGIRVALGAGTNDVMRMVLGESLRLSLVAVAIGLGVALALGRVVRSVLYGVSGADPITLVPVTVLILVVCLVASFLPARRATKVDPMVALRYE
ncbi:MAG TPA: ABC transporter permease [Polyangia bacterium]|jgi:putative ABC transport system permease protein|nr:ABC transporter permease [Polyangia bacterium]